MEEDKVKEEMAKRLVDAMDPETAKAILLQVVSGDDLYEAILDDGKAGPKPERKKARKTRADKGKSKTIPPDVPDEG